MSAALQITVVRYQCPDCRRTHAKKSTAEAHINRCWYRPANRGCKTCTHYEPAGDGAQCIPGDQCSCNSYPGSCTADARRTLTQPLTGCPDWQPATEETTR